MNVLHTVTMPSNAQFGPASVNNGHMSPTSPDFHTACMFTSFKQVLVRWEAGSSKKKIAVADLGPFSR